MQGNYLKENCFRFRDLASDLATIYHSNSIIQPIIVTFTLQVCVGVGSIRERVGDFDPYNRAKMCLSRPISSQKMPSIQARSDCISIQHNLAYLGQMLALFNKTHLTSTLLVPKQASNKVPSNVQQKSLIIFRLPYTQATILEIQRLSYTAPASLQGGNSIEKVLA